MNLKMIISYIRSLLDLEYFMIDFKYVKYKGN